MGEKKAVSPNSPPLTFDLPFSLSLTSFLVVTTEGRWVRNVMGVASVPACLIIKIALLQKYYYEL